VTTKCHKYTKTQAAKAQHWSECHLDPAAAREQQQRQSSVGRWGAERGRDFGGAFGPRPLLLLLVLFSSLCSSPAAAAVAVAAPPDTRTPRLELRPSLFLLVAL